MELKRIQESADTNTTPLTSGQGNEVAHVDHTFGSEEQSQSPSQSEVSQPTVYKEEHPEKLVKKYQINSTNLEKFLDVPPTDDNYY